MFKKMMYLAIISFIISGLNSSAVAIHPDDDVGSRLRGKDPYGHGLMNTKSVIREFHGNEKSDDWSKSEEYKRLEEKLKDLIDELKRLEKEVEKNVLRKIIPRIEREIEKLKERLKELRNKDDESEPIKVHVIDKGGESLGSASGE